MDDNELTRLECLRLSLSTFTSTPEVHVKMAAEFFNFIKGIAEKEEEKTDD